jgi:hypothetical protein
VERRGCVIRAGTIMGQLVTGGARRFRWRAAALRNGTSRVMGDCQARICEGLGVKFPGPTRRGANATDTQDADSADDVIAFDCEDPIS